MDLGSHQIPALLLVAAFAGFVQGLSGFGAILVALPLLSLLLGIKTAVPLAALLGLAGQVVLAFHSRWRLEWGLTLPVLIFSLPGGALGVRALGLLPAWHLQLLLAAILLVAAFLRSLPRWALRLRPRLGSSCLVGLLAGFLGGSIGAPGPPLVAYLLLADLDKNRRMEALTGGLLGLGVMVVLLQAFSGLIRGQTWGMALACLPALGLGVWGGRHIFHKMTVASTERLLTCLLILLAILILCKMLLAGRGV